MILNFFAGAVLFLFSSHQLFDLWSKPFSTMLTLALFLLPICVFLIFALFGKLKSVLFQLPEGKRIIFSISGLCLAIVFTLLTYHLPDTYQRIVISPGDTGFIELVEVKVDGNVINIVDAAVESGWVNKGDVFISSQDSTPLYIFVKAKVNSDCTVLFSNDQGHFSSAKISTGLLTQTISFSGGQGGQKLADFKTGYRGIPGMVFAIFLGLIDLFSYSILIWLFLLLQEKTEMNKESDSFATSGFKPHLPNLIILFTASLILHLWIALSIPLIVDVDSPTYLQGAVHLLSEGNLVGVSPIRGPGTTFLFAPIFLIFGRNPWGLKIFLHIIGIGSVLVGYWLGWLLSKNKLIAFLTGIFILLSPDVYLSSIFVMSDALNLFFVALFLAMVLNTHQQMSLQRTIFTLLVGAFVVLLRSENLIVLALGMIMLAIKPAYMVVSKKESTDGKISYTTKLIWVIISSLIAFLPLLWWSIHNANFNGFFGLSDYASEVFYDGWVYFGDASGLEFSDKNSPAMEKIESVIADYPVEISDRSGAATGWELFPYMLDAGYTRGETFDILHDAAIDSITNDWVKTYQLLLIKTRTALTPDPYPLFTYALPGEAPIHRTIERIYFDEETLSIPFIIKAFRNFVAAVNQSYATVYRYWFYISLISIYFVLHKKPDQFWFGLAIIVLAKIFIPNIMGIAIWRYTISSILLLQVFLAFWAGSIIIGLKQLFDNGKLKLSK